ncbi:filament-like plant protein 3 [Typha angustifolia]|uniref:filament-like plant protein 3 n=1 Tax=Typha angustifolia TaxID=59011 RepID=UPI003C2C458B
MDRRSWLWRRKSSETESSGSVSSNSERYTDDQEALRASSDNASPNHAQSLEVSSNIGDNEVHETVKSLSEKLSAALFNLSAKDDLVKQHSKVAEEAVEGWEQAEIEVTTLKNQLETAFQKNSTLEDQISHLDGALKECVRQLRHSREEQEEKIHIALAKKTREWESDKSELENQLLQLRKQLEAAKSEADAFQTDLEGKLDAVEKQNRDLKIELLARSDDLRLLAIERDLSNQAAETASKQHLESTKRMTKLEAECRRLQSLTRKTSSAYEPRPVTNSTCVESLTDSLSDSGERVLSVDNEPVCSDSWASALIAELDQFKHGKVAARNIPNSSVEINLMDDFLEMERLASLPETDHGKSGFELETDSDKAVARNHSIDEIEALRHQLGDLQGKVEMLERERGQLEMALADSRSQLDISCNQLTVAEDKLIELQRQLDLINESKQAAVNDVVHVESKRRELETQLESAATEVGKLRDEVILLEESVEIERALSAEYTVKAEVAEARTRSLEARLASVHLEVEKLNEKVGLLEDKSEKERALSAEFAVKAEAAEAARKALVSELDSTYLEVEKLREKVVLLEVKAEEERASSAEFAAKVEVAESARKEIECQLKTANIEVAKLCNKVGLLEGKIEEERALSKELVAKCQKLEALQLRGNREAELWRIANSNGELKIKQEKELAMAAGKLAECQKTIASLGHQLKSLTNLEEFMLETEKAEFDESLPDFGNGYAEISHAKSLSDGLHGFNLSNGRDKSANLPFPSISSTSSTFSGFLRLSPQNRNH